MERILQVPENAKCFVCGQPSTSVCLNYQTFVCDICKNAHEQFGHTCQSLETKFTDIELTTLSTGGNLAAQKTWLCGAKNLPTNPVDFIQTVFQEQRFRVFESDLQDDSDSGSSIADIDYNDISGLDSPSQTPPAQSSRPAVRINKKEIGLESPPAHSSPRQSPDAASPANLEGQADDDIFNVSAVSSSGEPSPRPARQAPAKEEEQDEIRILSKALESWFKAIDVTLSRK
eukprot:GCRY01004369.1.p1 GENE.GCRY01004369.1~~GCRY01004369.1.p1  ORF type:complete len:231 (+),score=21.11 GCRY01004369.1:127-819(+)